MQIGLGHVKPQQQTQDQAITLVEGRFGIWDKNADPDVRDRDVTR